MTKRIAALLCAVALLCVLSACGDEQPPAAATAATTIMTETPAETTIEPEPTTAPPPSYPFAPIPNQEPAGQSHEPLRGGEMVIERASINEIVKRFGAYESYSTELDVNGGHVQLTYPNLTVEIDGEFSFASREIYNSWPFGEGANVPLTKADKAVIGRVSYLFWTNPDTDIPAPRGLNIGDSENDVLRSYLDLRAKYEDEDVPWYATRLIYEESDSTENPGVEFNSSGYYQIYTDEEYPPPVACDYAISYSCSDMSFMLEGTTYYIKDSKIIAISQHCAEGD